MQSALPEEINNKIYTQIRSIIVVVHPNEATENEEEEEAVLAKAKTTENRGEKKNNTEIDVDSQNCEPVMLM